MDILQRKILNENDECFVLRASIDDPFVYLCFKGIIKRRYSNDEQISYHIQITKVLEDKEIIQTFLNRKRFRVFNNENGRTYNKKFYTYDLQQSFSFDSAFKKRFQNLYLDVHSSLVFDTETEMINTYKNINDHLISKLSNTLELLKQRHGNNQ